MFWNPGEDFAEREFEGPGAVSSPEDSTQEPGLDSQIGEGLCYDQWFWGSVNELPAVRQRSPVSSSTERMFDEGFPCRLNRRRTGGRVRSRAEQPAAPGAGAASGVELKDLKQKASYGYGYSLGKNLKAQGVEIDPEVFARGLFDALGGSPGH